MKIAYINGFNGQNSSKAEWLKRYFNATHIVLENHLNIDEVCKKLNPDFEKFFSKNQLQETIK